MEKEHYNHEEIIHSNNNNTVNHIFRTPEMKRLILLFPNIVFLLIGGIGGPLILRVYFFHGGDRKWFSGLLQTAGFPFLLVPIVFSFFRHRRTDGHGRLFSLTPPLLLYCTILGLITGIDDYLFSYSLSFLPVSTSSLLISTQLSFVAIFSFFIVKQKFNSCTVNAVVLLTFGAALLAVRANGDRPEGESPAKYLLGFVMTLVVAASYGLLLPLVELMYSHAKQDLTYKLIMEMQFVIGFVATIFCAVGMLVNRDFQAISREGKQYVIGETKYWLVVFCATVIAQFYLIGVVGTIKYSSALLSGVIITVCIPIRQLLAVFFFHEKFDGEKGVALALSLWGTTSYLYGEYKEHNKRKVNLRKTQLLPLSMDS